MNGKTIPKTIDAMGFIDTKGFHERLDKQLETIRHSKAFVSKDTLDKSISSVTLNYEHPVEILLTHDFLKPLTPEK